MMRSAALLLIAPAAAAAVAQQPAAPPRRAAADFCAAVRGPEPTGGARLQRPPTPAPVRGLYVNRWAAIGSRLHDLIGIARRTEINALVFDVKDDRGLVLYRSRVPLAHTLGADTTRVMRAERLRAALDTMRALGILPIARIVVMKDPLLAAARPHWVIRSRHDTAQAWRDERGVAWLDPYQDAPWHYAAQLACEAAALGFGEIQFDYVRFPDDPTLVRGAAFPLARGRTRAQAVRDALRRTRERLRSTGVPVTADVFGLTTTDTADMGIGQRWEQLITTVDVILPMMYPSHYWPGIYDMDDPNAHPYETVTHGLRDAIRRSAAVPGAATIRPWYQDFTLGPPHYGAKEVRAQIQAGYDQGIMSWLLWNSRSVYSVKALAPKAAADSAAARPSSARQPSRQ